MTDTTFDSLLGETLTKVDCLVGEEVAVFETASGKIFNLYHYQDCCESVYIEDVCGDVNDLIGSPILQAEENSSEDVKVEPKLPDMGEESHTWTFYRIATIKGQVVIRWFGTSNGYYSESVSFGLEDGGAK